MQQSKGSTSYKAEWYSLIMGLRIFSFKKMYLHVENPLFIVLTQIYPIGQKIKIAKLIFVCVISHMPNNSNDK